MGLKARICLIRQGRSRVITTWNGYVALNKYMADLEKAAQDQGGDDNPDAITVQLSVADLQTLIDKLAAGKIGAAGAGGDENDKFHASMQARYAVEMGGILEMAKDGHLVVYSAQW